MMSNAFAGLMVAALLLAPAILSAGTATWKQTAAGTYSWNDTANWNPATIPNATNDVANMGVALAGAQTINLNIPVTLGNLTFGGNTATANTMLLAAGTAGSLTFATNSGNAKLISLQPSLFNSQADVISAPITLGCDLDAYYAFSLGSRSITFSGGISEVGGVRNMSLSGMNYIFSGNNTYSGKTTLSEGSLKLDYTLDNNSKLSSLAQLVMNKSSLTVTGNTATATAQTVSGVTISNGIHSITVNPSLNQNVTLNIGPLTRTGPGSILFKTTKSGSGQGVITTTTANTNGILGGFATFGSDWAINNGVNVITNLTTYSVNTFTSGTNVNVTSVQTPAANIAINSLKMSANVTLSGANNVIASGGILIPSGSYTTLSGGTLTSGNGKDLIINQNGGELTLNSAIADNGATPIGITVGGNGGNLTIGGASTFSGDMVLAGSLTVKSQGSLGTTGTVWFTQPCNLAFQTPTSAVFSNNFVFNHRAFLNFFLYQNGANNITLAGTLRVATGSQQNILPSGVAGSSLTLLGNNSGFGIALGTYGALRLGHPNGNGNAAIGFSMTNYTQAVYVLDGVNYASAITVNSTTNGAPVFIGMDAPGAAIFSGALTLGSAETPAVARSVYVTATNGATATFSGQIKGSTGRSLPLIKNGAGTVILTGNNTYPGGTIINNGILSVSNNAALGTGLLTLAGGMLSASAGSWTIANTVNLVSNSVIDTGANSLTLSGAITNSGALTKTGSGTLTLTGSNTYSGTTVISGGQVKFIRSPSVFGINYFKITGDADSGISSNNIYTHAINPNGGSAIVNGIPFTGAGVNTLPAGDLVHKSYTGTNGTVTINNSIGTSFFGSNVLGGYNGWAGIMAGGLYTLFGNAIYGGSTRTNVLNGLSPNTWYDVRLYHRPWGTSGRSFSVNYDVGNNGSVEYASPTIDEDAPQNTAALAALGIAQTNAWAMSYVFQTGESETNIALTVITGSYHGYGISCQKVMDVNVFQGTLPAATVLSMTNSATLNLTGSSQTVAGLQGFGGTVTNGTLTVTGTLAPGGTGVIGDLTVNADLALAPNVTYDWNFGTATQDTVNVTGTLTLPTVATVSVSRVTGPLVQLPESAVLMTFTTGPSDGALSGWVITGARGGSYAIVRNNKVMLISPNGTLIRFL
jgi:autotransporter-associated beta strand protein